MWLELVTTLALAAAAPATGLYEIPLKTLMGEPTTLKPFEGKVMLIVNTASKCGYTPQYQGLQALHAKFKDKGFTVLGFPSNDFFAQEPGSAQEIKEFCDRKFHVAFPMFEKGKVTGNERQPLYAYLSENAPERGAVGWNFEKFLIDRHGKIIGRYKSKVTPENPELVAAVEKALAEK